MSKGIGHGHTFVPRQVEKVCPYYEGVTMIRFLACVLSSVCLVSAAHAIEQNEKELAIKTTIRELDLEKITAEKERTLREKTSRQEAALEGAKFFAEVQASFEDEDNCQPRNEPSSCWKACRAEGWGSSTCANRCGVSSNAASLACWNYCQNEGWGSSTCANRCGVVTGGGSASCWKYCRTEGWGSSTCANRCGISTRRGQEACWDYCTDEGWGSGTCANRCGT